MITLQAMSIFIGLWIGMFFTAVGLTSMAAMFINRDQSLGGICIWSSMLAFGITLTIALLKPI